MSATDPTTEELVAKLNKAASLEIETGVNFDVVEQDGTIVLTADDMSWSAKRLSDLEGKLGEARKALERIKGFATPPSSENSITAFSAIHSEAFCALKLTASGGGEDNSLSQGASVAHPSVRPDEPHSAGGREP